MRDYRRFARVAQACLRPVAEQMGYAPANSASFARQHPAGWHEIFWLHTRCSDSEDFSVCYGIAVTDLYFGQPPLALHEAPVVLHETLRNAAGGQAFGRANRVQVGASAQAIARLYPKQARPWLDHFTSWHDIATAFARKHYKWLDATQLGRYTAFSPMQATYALLLIRAGQPEVARHWLEESRRLLEANEHRDDWEAKFLQSITLALKELARAFAPPKTTNH
ncbi:hypothetical protein EBQ25_09550 [Allofranklinella schreckenbergeri]|uniref:DUF4304 domain-containing protein n=2 Tax=Allofranklinella schreckenbergeri TaxID=1076744 RepID=A0A3M6Q5U3_9BURK|nr:hypothetical protein EBQ25_09550 [Allofranklinella schreckenbergeri]